MLLKKAVLCFFSEICAGNPAMEWNIAFGFQMGHFYFHAKLSKNNQKSIITLFSRKFAWK